MSQTVTEFFTPRVAKAGGDHVDFRTAAERAAGLKWCFCCGRGIRPENVNHLLFDVTCGLVLERSEAHAHLAEYGSESEHVGTWPIGPECAKKHRAFAFTPDEMELLFQKFPGGRA